ncbi:Por secretion system C-terminal sorting domain-containing protein [Flavobacterium resistens]|uniref:Por secretion system C-terminal sorting domain-containing protein n=1 Tax=Flavobacterium resistens TaxID=443612 RepID=A0A521DHJ2_9FLAO|nr:endonuclease [Flavobacterium resistens]MRX68731.1 T9SS type A sorting domain-containing protein [Flavobacterium resistens]SMO71183.1 Por secretion system C-terminal sorting domain-containing protein [Flavobacterium resistens]
MKKNYFLLLLVLTSIGFAQIPSGYYNTATGTGYTLKTQLYNIIKGHTDNGYAGLYTTYQTSDVDNFYENDGTVLDMYSENPSGTDPYNYSTGSTQRCGNYSVEGDCYNREHIIPQSVFNEQSPMVADAHFITPTDGKVNGMRSNYPHGTVASATYTSQNGGKLGSSSVSGYSGTVFEPINDFKGDIARMYFYFATRYENTVAGYSYAMFNGSSNQVFTTAFLNMLLAWHSQDPVSAREIARNNAIYARQNNRNPFIDHPEYVNQIWGGTPSGDTQAPTTPTSLASTSKTATSISLSWTASTDNVAVTGYDIYANSVLKTTVSGVTATITGLTASTAYSIYVKAKDAAGNASASSNTISVTTNSSGTGTATDLLFSEYIEGSGNNKALEIANNTGSSVSLSAYTIKKQTNGAGAWSTGLALTGTLTTGSKFVIVNSSISSTCFSPSSANISTTATELTFNGNDAVGLFKNGVLIDIIGTFNGGTANFAVDVTLRRKSTVTSPSTTFNLSSQWDSFTQDTCNNLASKKALPVEDEEIVESSDEILIYPNPSDGNFNVGLNDFSTPYSIEILSFSGQKVFEKLDTTASSVSISHLSKGIYVVKIVKDSRTIIKKIVIN